MEKPLAMPGATKHDGYPGRPNEHAQKAKGGYAAKDAGALRHGDGGWRGRDHLSHRAQAPLIPQPGLKGLDPVPARVIDAIRTCRPTCQDKIGIDLAPGTSDPAG